jgi:hypothetical protein
MGADIYFNMTEDELERVYDVTHISPGRQIMDIYFADMESDKIGPNYANFNIPNLAKFMGREKRANKDIYTDEEQLKNKEGNAEMKVNGKGNNFDLINHKLARMGECPSGANHSNARGMAKMAAFMANKGTFEGKTILSEKVWEEFHSEP